VSATAVSTASTALSPALDAALRAQLRTGEEVVWAQTPRLPRDLARFGRLGRFDTPAVIAFAMVVLMSVAFTSWAVNEIRGASVPFEGWIGGLLFGTFLFQSVLELRKELFERRRIDGSIHAVTTERVLRIETYPKPRVESWEADAIVEISRWNIRGSRGPAVGNVRFLKGITSHDGNAFMRVPEPEACEAALRALLARRPAAVTA